MNSIIRFFNSSFNHVKVNVENLSKFRSKPLENKALVIALPIILGFTLVTFLWARHLRGRASKINHNNVKNIIMISDNDEFFNSHSKTIKTLLALQSELAKKTDWQESDKNKKGTALNKVFAIMYEKPWGTSIIENNIEDIENDIENATLQDLVDLSSFYARYCDTSDFVSIANNGTLGKWLTRLQALYDERQAIL